MCIETACSALLHHGRMANHSHSHDDCAHTHSLTPHPRPPTASNRSQTDVHVHLDGSLRLETVIDLAKKAGLDLPSEDPDELREKVGRLTCPRPDPSSGTHLPAPRQLSTLPPTVSALRMGAAARRSLRARRFTGECGVLSGAPEAWWRH